jgi:hypothetical protein
VTLKPRPVVYDCLVASEVVSCYRLQNRAVALRYRTRALARNGLIPQRETSGPAADNGEATFGSAPGIRLAR